jgi:hypothetical protein
MADAGGAGSGGGMGTGVGNETLVCRASTPAGTEGVTCNASDPTTCAAGTTCGEPGDGSLDAVCYRFCDTDADCTAPGGWCHAGPLQTGPTEGFTAKTCTLDCDPMAQTGCGAGEKCNLLLTPSHTRLFTTCMATGTGGSKTPCTRSEDCLAGYSCEDVSLGGALPQPMCLKLCTISPASQCPTGQTCQPVAPPNSLGATQYGWCY